MMQAPLITELPLTVCSPEQDRSTREERDFTREVEAWLRGQTVPEGSVLWYPHWDRSSLVEVTDTAHLARLIAGLELGDWGGISLAVGDGRWAQVMCAPDDTKDLELHPYQHNRPSLPFVWESFPQLSAGEAATRAWRWVQGAFS